jgi:hypothetical protein
MARFIDLDDSDDDSSHDASQSYSRQLLVAARSNPQTDSAQPAQVLPMSTGENEHASTTGFAAALACYPYAYMNTT